ncbi:hypothetical protein FCJ61_13915 [Burkholderia metallica]|uniref:hypothetical protein n=1 Tax=Burkholderia metallica TaxID=488729 RepID=UPI00157AFA5F|nr:hypothetical protein [Burkholderia metallica]NTZ84063.1 hypothetical protein [Burkholderia metallica]
MSIGLVMATLPFAAASTSASEAVTFTVEASALRYQYASPPDNRKALAEMLQHASVVGHYWKPATVFETSRCMTDVVCFPSPHLASETKDHPVTVRPRVVPGAPWQESVRLRFDLPVSHRGASLDGVSLVLPLKFMWQQPSAQLVLQKAEAALADYQKTRRAFERDASVTINLELPKVLGEPGPVEDHCAGIPNPLSWSSSGVVGIRTLAQIGSQRNVPWSQTRVNEDASRLGTEESCATWRPDVENTYRWGAEP